MDRSHYSMSLALAKKCRTEEEIDVEIIDKILAKLRVLRAKLNPSVFRFQK